MSDLLDILCQLALGWLFVCAVMGLAAGFVWVLERLGRDRVAQAFSETKVPRMWGDET